MQLQMVVKGHVYPMVCQKRALSHTGQYCYTKLIHTWPRGEPLKETKSTTRYKLESNAQPGGLQYSTLITVLSEHPD